MDLPNETLGEQIDELVGTEAYSDALALLDSIDPAVLPDKVYPLLQTIISSLITCYRIDAAT